MTVHLEEHELTAAVAGLDLDREARDHLQSCLLCRRQVQVVEDLIVERRQQAAADEPDWQAQHAAIMARLPEEAGNVVPLRRRWRWTVLAAAASLVLALGATVLYLERGGAGPTIGSDRAEQILAEVEETLDSDEIPGFGVLGDTLLEAAADQETEDDEKSTAWDVALSVLEDDGSRYEVPGFEAMGMLVPSMAELESMINNHTEAS